MEVKDFIEIRESKQIIPFTVAGYFSYILAMGIMLSAGAIYTLFRRKPGFVLLWIYIGMHAALFINFLEINPKIIMLVLQVILLFLLYYLRPPKPITDTTNSNQV